LAVIVYKRAGDDLSERGGGEWFLQCWKCGKRIRIDKPAGKFSLTKVADKKGWLVKADFKTNSQLVFCSEKCFKRSYKNGLFVL